MVIDDTHELSSALQNETGYKISCRLGIGAQSIAYRANNGTGKDVCLKVALVALDCEYYMQTITGNQFAGKRKVDLPILKSGSFCHNDKMYEWVVTDIAQPITYNEYDRFLEKLIRYNVIFPDDGIRQCGKVNGKTYIIDYNSIVSIDELPEYLQKFCRYVKRKAKTMDYDTELAANWRSKCYNKLSKLGHDMSDYRDNLGFFVRKWISTRTLYAE